MERMNWFDSTTHHPVIDEQAGKLALFAEAMADGIIEKQELARQELALVAVMREVEPQLSDTQHAAVTRLLVELSAYNVMRTLHELHAQRLQNALSR